MKRSLHQNAADCRSTNRGNGYSAIALCALSLCVALSSFAVLSAPAIALTEDAATEIGVVTTAEAEAAAPEIVENTNVAETSVENADAAQGEQAALPVESETEVEAPVAEVALPQATDSTPAQSNVAGAVQPTAVQPTDTEPATQAASGEATAVAPATDPEPEPAPIESLLFEAKKKNEETGEETPDYTITLTCPQEAAVPADATLDVREIEPGSDEYNDYYARAIQALVDDGAAAKAEDVHITYARLFDITILVDGEEFEPAAPVQVDITYAEDAATVADATDERKVIHFATEEDGTETPELLDTEVTEHEDGTATLGCKPDSFSNFGILRVSVKATDNGTDALDNTLGGEEEEEVVNEGDGNQAQIFGAAGDGFNIGTDSHVTGITSSANVGDSYDRNANFAFSLNYKLSQENIVSNGYKAYYDLPAALQNVISATGTSSGPIKQSGVSVGSYTIEQKSDGTYRVKFVYDQSYIDGRDSFDGTFNFSGSIKTAESDNKEEVDIGFPGSGESIVIPFKGGDVTGSKSNTINKEDKTVTFTIPLTVTGQDADNFKLTDTLGSNLKFLGNASNNYGFEITPALESTPTVTVDGKVAALNISKLPIGTYTLTYTVGIEDATNLAQTSNQAQWEWKAGEKDRTYGPVKSWVNFTQGGVKKDGTYDKNSNVITWKVTVHPGNFSSASGTRLVDTLKGNNQTYVNGSFKLYPEDDINAALKDLTVVIDADTGTFSYTLPDGLPIDKAYVLEYQTKPNDEPTAETTYNNEVEWTPGGGGQGGTAPGGAEYKPESAPDPNIINKSSAPASVDHEVPWSISVNPAGFGTNPTKPLTALHLQDYVIYSYNPNSNPLSYKEDSFSFLDAATSEPIDLVAGQDYTLEFHDNGPTTTTSWAAKKWYDLSFTPTGLEKLSGKEFIINYVTVGTGWISNTVDSGYTIDGKDYTEHDTSWGNHGSYKTALTKSADISTVFENGEIKWTVFYDGNKAPLYNLGEYLFTDFLPSGLSYKEGTATYSVYGADTFSIDGSAENAGNYGSITPVLSGNELGFRFNFRTFFGGSTNAVASNGSLNNITPQITLNFTTTINNLLPGQDDSTFTNDNGKLAFKNNVDFTHGSSTLASATATATVEKGYVAKLSKPDANPNNVNEITYTIYVNQNAEQLGDGDTIVLQDQLDTHATYVPGSIKVVDMGVDGTPAVDFTSSFGFVDGKGQALTLTLPNAQSLKVTYNAYVEGEAGKDVTVANSAWLEGHIDQISHNSQTIKVVKSGATLQGTGTVTIHKMDKETSHDLKDVSFSLYKLSLVEGAAQKDSNNQPVFTCAMEDAKTDASGLLDLKEDGNSLDSGTLYYFKETHTLSGYKLDETPHYFMVDDESNPVDISASLAQWDIAESISADTVSLFPADGYTIPVYNVACPPSYTLPETGGIGTMPYLFGGLALMGIGVLGFTLRKKREGGRQAH